MLFFPVFIVALSHEVSHPAETNGHRPREPNPAITNNSRGETTAIGRQNHTSFPPATPRDETKIDRNKEITHNKKHFIVERHNNDGANTNNALEPCPRRRVSFFRRSLVSRTTIMAFSLSFISTSSWPASSGRTRAPCPPGCSRRSGQTNSIETASAEQQKNMGAQTTGKINQMLSPRCVQAAERHGGDTATRKHARVV